MAPFRIIVDTSCDLPEEYIAEHDISTIPIPFNLDGVQHSGGRWQEISDKSFYKALHNGSIAGTALINPDSYVQKLSEFTERGEDILSIVLSGGLSGTYQNSVIALDEVKGKYPGCSINTVDSLNAAGGVGLLTALAVKKRGEGMSAGEVAAWLEQKKNNCISLFTVDDLMFLHRGGRLTKLSAVAGSIIGIKPLLNIAPDGTLKLKDKVRGRKGALKTLVNQMKRALLPGARLDTVVISHSDCLEDADTLASMVKTSVNVQEVVIVMMGPVIGAHVGPGTVALFFEADMTRAEYEKRFYDK